MRPRGNTTRGLPVVSPTNMLPVQVIDRYEVAPGVVSVQLVLPGTRQAPTPYLPGQFITLALPTPKDTLYRSYSLCGAGEMDEPWELTIKQLNMGAVSTYFYDHVQKGTLLYASLPRGTFTLPSGLGPNNVLIMVATGSGITPIMGMLRAISRMPEDQQPLVQLHYASKTPDDIIFGDELYGMDPDELWLRQKHYLSSSGQRMTADAILSRVGNMAKRAEWYLCGAEALKKELHELLSDMGVPDRVVHSEVFAQMPGRPAYRVTGGPGQGVGGTMRIEETGATLDIQPEETILTALERHGYKPEFSCRVGACGACKLRVLDGQVNPVGEALSSSEKSAGYVLTCLARPIGDITLASGGRPPKGVTRIAAVAGGSGSRGAAVGLTRVAAVAGVGLLLLGSWNLTDHRPVSWGSPAASVSAPTTGTDPNSTDPNAQLVPTATLAPGAPPRPTATKSAKPGVTPPPAATQPPAATAAPKPTPAPKATSTPSA
ncbi:MAG TPA: 2Fe-2S iron-sulfur cluster-binding protein [Ktedonobacterales bacterium]